MRCVDDPGAERIAILYQAIEPPVIDGLRKDAKPGGYSDSGADMGYVLRGAGFDIVTPVADPDPATPFDWVFPDTAQGIADALTAGATLLWANTVLFAGHPIEAVKDRVWVVGQDPVATQAVDDKFATNARLREAGLPVVESRIAQADALDAIDDLVFPIVVKPIRGRGSQGVTVAQSRAEMLDQARALIAGERFGATVMLERFLPGLETTVTVMPPGSGEADGPWALPPVGRTGQVNGVAPYNGDVPVSRNSAVLSDADRATPEVDAMLADCVAVARLIGTRAPIRIDCRADDAGRFWLFDINMKPNLTGAGRPGREAEDSLSALAARAIGWSYADLLRATLRGAWKDME